MPRLVDARQRRNFPMRVWMSPNFGSVGCLGAVLFWFLVVVAVLGLLYIPWSPVVGRP
jgi:hypothetical protein